MKVLKGTTRDNFVLEFNWDEFKYIADIAIAFNKPDEFYSQIYRKKASKVLRSLLKNNAEQKVTTSFSRDELNYLSFAVTQYDDANNRTIRNNLIRILWGEKPIKQDDEKSNILLELRFQEDTANIRATQKYREEHGEEKYQWLLKIKRDVRNLKRRLKRLNG